MNRINNKLPNNLVQLQHCIKSDPSGYKQEFQQQYEHFKSLLDLFHSQSSSYDKTFIDLIMFLAHVCACYPDELSTYPNDLIKTLRLFSMNLHPEIRMTLVRALIFLRNKSLLAAEDLITILFEMLKCPDKKLRVMIREHILSDIKNINAKHKNHKANTFLQNFMFAKMKDSNLIYVKTSLLILIELYRKNIWNDSRTVNVIATALFSKTSKILAIALQFFLGKDEAEQNGGEKSDDDSDDENLPSAQDLTMATKINKKTRKRKRLLLKSKEVLRKYKNKTKTYSFNFSAIHLLNDPQSLAENLFKLLEKFNQGFELKLLLINLISRLIGIHELLILNFYPFLQRFLHPRQQEVTKFLQYIAQASHELVPPDSLEPILKVIANNFVTERNSHEVMAVGINSIREICSRCPLAMNEDLLQDLVQYNSFKDKNVSMAAKSLIQLYRIINPKMLKKKDRGRPTEASQENHSHQYGQSKALSYISGAEILNETESHDNFILDKTPTDRCNRDGDESDGSWIQVSDDDNDDDRGEENDLEEESASDVQNEIDENRIDPIQKAEQISMNRILSQEEFQKVKLAQLTKHLKGPRSKKNKSDLDKPNNIKTIPANIETKEIVPLSDIERLYKKSKENKEDRIRSIEYGREDREKFGSKRRKGKRNEYASKNKREIQKGKSFMMIKHKVNRKQKKRSFKEKQIALRNSLLKRCK
ncbi:SDA1-like protein [Sarcoptes scabiei]|uniref:Protein SDA1 n=1 Tax=Sarcoptes scabiei TaxID=52283 RepID=A0A132ALI3_SARSC|nr:SDA1-like protein [Sarcoptes scabiei]